MQITYQKSNGNIIQRLRKSELPYKIGDTTSMGWKVLNIEYQYNNNYYSKNEYNSLIQKNIKVSTRKKQTTELIIKEFKAFIYYFIAVLLVNLMIKLLGM